MLSDIGRSRIEDLIRSLGKTQVGYVVSSVYHRHIFIGERIRNHLLQNRCACGRFGTCLDYRRVASGKTCREDSQRKQEREIERTYYESCSVGHLIDFRYHTGKTEQSAEVRFGSRPFSESVYGLIDLEYDASHIAEIRFHGVPSEVCPERVGHPGLISLDCSFESAELLDPPVYIQRFSCSEKCFLFFEYRMNAAFIPSIICHEPLTSCENN